MTVQDFQIILEKQTGLFQQLADHQIRLQEAVFDKNYADAERSISAMKGLSESIRLCEARRQQAYLELLDQMGISEEFGLTMLFASLEHPARENLARAFRDLKVSVLQVRTVNEGIMAYAGTQMETMESIIDELYPSRRDGMYTNRGYRQKTSQPLVLDHSL
jgi:hypothetical protein